MSSLASRSYLIAQEKKLRKSMSPKRKSTQTLTGSWIGLIGWMKNWTGLWKISESKVSKDSPTVAKATQPPKVKTMATTKMGKPTMKPGMSTAKDGMKKPTPMANTMMAPATPMGMKKGGMPMKMKDGKKVPIFAAKGGGIESKGKTKGKMITMKKGGRAC